MRSHFLLVGLLSVGCGKGDHGIPGAMGEKGNTGLQGPVGAQGVVGPQGPVGFTGAQGVAGIPGLVGPVGPVGATGSQGVQGIPGLQGVAGQNATSVTTVKFCHDDTSAFPEYGIVIGSSIYAVYWGSAPYSPNTSEAFLALIKPGNYMSTGGNGCYFTVHSDGSITE